MMMLKDFMREEICPFMKGFCRENCALFVPTDNNLGGCAFRELFFSIDRISDVGINITGSVDAEVLNRE